jgi:hypothetical protein
MGARKATNAPHAGPDEERQDEQRRPLKRPPFTKMFPEARDALSHPRRGQRFCARDVLEFFSFAFAKQPPESPLGAFALRQLTFRLAQQIARAERLVVGRHRFSEWRALVGRHFPSPATMEIRHLVTRDAEHPPLELALGCRRMPRRQGFRQRRLNHILHVARWNASSDEPREPRAESSIRDEGGSIRLGRCFGVLHVSISSELEEV